MDDFTGHIRRHYKDGLIIWAITSIMGECHSKITGEVFTYKEIDLRGLAFWTTYTANFNLKGNQGHHYIGTFIVDVTDWEFVLDPVVVKAICVENGPNK